jgi:hypothetical protein
MNLENIYFEMHLNNEVWVNSDEGNSSYRLYCTYSFVYGQEFENGIGLELHVDYGICLESYEDGTEEEYGYAVNDDFVIKLSEMFTDYVYDNYSEIIEERLNSDYYYFRHYE